MMNMFNDDISNAFPVKRGKCTYANTTEYEVIIVKWHILYGTGDYEDPIEIQEDQNVDCYYIFHENLIKKGDFNAGGGAFLSLKDAIASVESDQYFVKWL